MHRRLVAIALILVTILQGPAIVYAGTLGSSTLGDALTHACNGQTLGEGSDCDSCCSHGAMPSCAAQCSVPVTAAFPLKLPTAVRILSNSVVIPDFGIAPFVSADPPHPLRPPIV